MVDSSIYSRLPGLFYRITLHTRAFFDIRARNPYIAPHNRAFLASGFQLTGALLEIEG